MTEEYFIFALLCPQNYCVKSILLMTQQELETVIKDLQALPKECEWVEFKVNDSNNTETGEYISALSNSACYHGQPFGYLVFGIENITHRIVGTNFRPFELRGFDLRGVSSVVKPKIVTLLHSQRHILE